MAVSLATILSLAGTAASGIMSALNNKKMRSEQADSYAQEQGYYRGKANEEASQNSAVQQSRGDYDRYAREKVANAASKSVVTGATPEYNAAVQKALAEGKANLEGRVQEKLAKRQDDYSDKEQKSKDDQYKEKRKDRLARNETYGNIAINAANAFGSMVDGFSSANAKKNALPVVTSDKKLNTAAPTQYGVVSRKGTSPQATADAYKAAADLSKKDAVSHSVLATTAAAAQQVADAGKQSTSVATDMDYPTDIRREVDKRLSWMKQ